jgi:hypothetical protein
MIPTMQKHNLKLCKACFFLPAILRGQLSIVHQLYDKLIIMSIRGIDLLIVFRQEPV